MRILKAILVILILWPLCANAVIVDISVATNKSTYLLGEEVTVFVTAYNPNPQPTVLYFGSALQASYLMDGIFDWTQGKWFADVLTERPIGPYDSCTWNLIHGSDEMSLYPLNIGTHNVVGEVVGYGWSTPIEFEVIPEPATILLLGLGGLALVRKRREE